MRSKNKSISWHCPHDPIVLACVPIPGLEDLHPLVSKYRWARIVRLPYTSISNLPQKTIPYAAGESFGFYNGCLGPAPDQRVIPKSSKKEKRRSLFDHLREQHKAKLAVFSEFQRKGITREGIGDLLSFLANRTFVYLCYIPNNEKGLYVLPSNIDWCEISLAEAIDMWPFIFDIQHRRFVLLKEK